MMKTYVLPLTLAGIFFAAAPVSWADDVLIASWNFNDEEERLAVSHGAGTMTLEMDEGFDWFGGTTENAVGDDPAGAAFSPQGGTDLANNGKGVTFALSMSGFTALNVSYATQGTGTGFTTQDWSWKVDEGDDFVSVGDPIEPPGSFATVAPTGLSEVAELTNADAAWIRVVFDGATGASGNNRLDNIQFNATPIPEPSTYAAVLGIVGLAVAVWRKRRGAGMRGHAKSAVPPLL